MRLVDDQYYFENLIKDFSQLDFSEIVKIQVMDWTGYKTDFRVLNFEALICLYNLTMEKNEKTELRKTRFSNYEIAEKII